MKLTKTEKITITTILLSVIPAGALFLFVHATRPVSAVKTYEPSGVTIPSIEQKKGTESELEPYIYKPTEKSKEESKLQESEEVAIDIKEINAKVTAEVKEIPDVINAKVNATVTEYDEEELAQGEDDSVGAWFVDGELIISEELEEAEKERIRQMYFENKQPLE